MKSPNHEQHYIEAKRRLDLASGRLTSLDAQIVDVAGAMASWRASWRRATDPESAVACVVSLPWPDHATVESAFDEWLAAYHEAIESWGRLPAAAQLRFNQPTRPSRSA